jgi:hypothetical protein
MAQLREALAVEPVDPTISTRERVAIIVNEGHEIVSEAIVKRLSGTIVAVLVTFVADEPRLLRLGETYTVDPLGPGNAPDLGGVACTLCALSCVSEGVEFTFMRSSLIRDSAVRV